jgi:hypothetical protein
VLPSDQELSLGPLATSILTVVPFRAYCFLLNASWKWCSVRVCSTAWDSASITSIVSKWRHFSYHLQSWKLGEVGWVGTTVIMFWVKKFPCENGSVRRCVVVMQQPVLLSPKFGAKSSHIFHAVVVKCQSTRSMWNWLFGLPGWIQSPLIWTFRVRLILSSPNAYLIIARAPKHFFRNLHKIWCSSFVGSIASHRVPNKRT